MGKHIPKVTFIYFIFASNLFSKRISRKMID